MKRVNEREKFSNIFFSQIVVIMISNKKSSYLFERERKKEKNRDGLKREVNFLFISLVHIKMIYVLQTYTQVLSLFIFLFLFFFFDCFHL